MKIEDRKSSSPRANLVVMPCPSLWIDRYMPIAVKDVAVHKKKVEEIRQWMQRVADGDRQLRSDGGGNVLIVHGGPGIGKTTLIRALAKEMKIRIRRSDTGTLGSEDVRADTDRNLLYRGTSEIHALRRLLDQGLRYRSLRTLSSVEEEAAEIVLIDPVPHLRDANDKSELSIMLERFARLRPNTSRAYAVVIATEHTKPNSDQSRRRSRDRDASAADGIRYLFSAAFLASPRVRCVRINPVSRTAMRTALRRIAAFERSVSTALIDDVVESADGDVRHAVNTLQWSTTTHRSRRDEGREWWKSKGATSSSSKMQRSRKRQPVRRCGKREFLMPFHAVGKLLYAKRTEESSTRGAASLEKAPLAFDPEHVVERSGFDASRCLSIVHHNCPDFFTRIDELSATVSHFCDADLLATTGARQPTRCDGAFPAKYVSSVAARAVANENDAPAKRTFRKITGPRGYGIWAAARSNRRIGRRLLMSSTSLGASTHEGVQPGGTAHAAGFLDTLPALKRLSVRDALAYDSFASVANYSPPYQTREIGSRAGESGSICGSWDEKAVRGCAERAPSAPDVACDDGTESDPIEE